MLYFLVKKVNIFISFENIYIYIYFTYNETILFLEKFDFNEY